ncbi:MOSC N-terminal beta barrel domain-containing protein [Fennellomyces sp. T-0311]|nr:MOSC N-terminal beta barrel domain-containing protein [Fennellomyces sp. T-0311]
MPTTEQPRLSTIRAYPIKSCHCVELPEAKIDAMGISIDRRFMFIEEESGRFITQRKYSSMALIRPLVDQAADTITLTGQGQPDLVLPLHPPLENKRTAVIWKDTVTVFDMGDEASAWINKFFKDHQQHNLDNPVGDEDVSVELPVLRLVTIANPSTGQYTRPAHQKLPGVHAPLSDSSPISFGFESSLVSVNDGLKETGISNGKSIPIDRFRHNLTISGTVAWEEDEWLVVRIGEVTFYVMRPTARCPVPGINQDTGVKDDWGRSGVLEYLSLKRNIPDHNGKSNGCFCVDAAPLTSGTIRVDDAVEVLERIPAQNVERPVPPTHV